MSLQQIRTAVAVDGGGDGEILGHQRVGLGERAHLGRERGVVVPEQGAGLTAHHVEVVAIQQRRVEHHRGHPVRVAHPHTGGQVGAVGGPVHRGGVDAHVVENGGGVVDHLRDGQRLGRKVRTRSSRRDRPTPRCSTMITSRPISAARLRRPWYAAMDPMPGPPGMISSGVPPAGPVRT